MKWRRVANGAVWLGAGIAIGIAVAPEPNARPRYGKLGLPANCHALVFANLNGYQAKQYTAEEALGSIARSCGLLAPMWRE